MEEYKTRFSEITECTPLWMLERTKRTNKICKTCQGEKTVSVTNDSPNYEGPFRKPCPVCGGTGIVKRHKKVWYEKIDRIKEKL